MGYDFAFCRANKICVTIVTEYDFVCIFVYFHNIVDKSQQFTEGDLALGLGGTKNRYVEILPAEFS